MEQGDGTPLAFPVQRRGCQQVVPFRACRSASLPPRHEQLRSRDPCSLVRICLLLRREFFVALVVYSTLALISISAFQCFFSHHTLVPGFPQKGCSAGCFQAPVKIHVKLCSYVHRDCSATYGVFARYLWMQGRNACMVGIRFVCFKARHRLKT